MIFTGILYPLQSQAEFDKNANSDSVIVSFSFCRVGLATIGVCVFCAVTSVAALFILELLKMKIGFRTPSLKKSIRARTTGKIKRKMKKSINPFYGKKGMGFIKNPKRAIKNKIYHKTTFGLGDVFRWLSK